MRGRRMRTTLGRFHRDPNRYADLTADCREELALIADRRRSEPFGPFSL